MAKSVPQKDDVDHWTVEQMAAWLQQVELAECCDTFLRKGIDGHKFLQLSEEDLFLWGRDASIKNRKQILRLLSQIKNSQQNVSTTSPFKDLHLGRDSQGGTTPNIYHAGSSDTHFISDCLREEESSVIQMQPLQDNNMQDEGCEDIYLRPIEPRTVTSNSNQQSKELRVIHPQSHLHFKSKKIPWVVSRSHSKLETHSSGFSSMSPSCDWDSSPLTEPFITQNKEKNEHVYETVGSPATSCAGSESVSSGVCVADLDDRDLSCQLSSVALCHKKVVPHPHSRSQSGGNDSCLTQLSTSVSRSQFPCKKPPKTKPPLPVHISHINHKTFSQESQVTPFTPLVPTQTHSYANLDDGKTLLLTPLYKEMMETPYFHLLSRTKAKTLLMSGEDGTFLIRPSTHSGEALTLTLKLGNRSYNINIRQRPDSLFALGTEKAQEKTFSSVDELIKAYSREPIKLQNGKGTILKQTLPKTTGS